MQKAACFDSKQYISLEQNCGCILSPLGSGGSPGPELVTTHTQLPLISWVRTAVPHKLSTTIRAQDGASLDLRYVHLQKEVASPILSLLPNATVLKGGIPLLDPGPPWNALVIN